MNYSQLFLVSGLLLTCLAHDINCMDDEKKPIVQIKQTYDTTPLWSTITNSAHKDMQQLLKTQEEEEEKKLEKLRKNEAWEKAKKNGAQDFFVTWFNAAARHNNDPLRLGISRDQFIDKIYDVSDKKKKRVFKPLNYVDINRHHEIITKLFNKESVDDNKAKEFYYSIYEIVKKSYEHEQTEQEVESEMVGFFCCIPYVFLKCITILSNKKKDIYDWKTLTNDDIE